MARIFLSHSSRDNVADIAMRDWLIGEGWDDIFLDLDSQRGLHGGAKWRDELKNAEARCEIVILLISSDWLASPWCVSEYTLAAQMGKRIIGLFVESTPMDEVPVELRADWQLIDLTGEPREWQTTVNEPEIAEGVTVSFNHNGLERLRIGLRRAGPTPTSFPGPPRRNPSVPSTGGCCRSKVATRRYSSGARDRS